MNQTRFQLNQFETARWLASLARIHGNAEIANENGNRIVLSFPDGSFYALTVEQLEDADESYSGQRVTERQMEIDAAREREWYTSQDIEDNEEAGLYDDRNITAFQALNDDYTELTSRAFGISDDEL